MVGSQNYSSTPPFVALFLEQLFSFEGNGRYFGLGLGFLSFVVMVAVFSVGDSGLCIADCQEAQRRSQQAWPWPC
jgi:hypothetical protein